MIAEVLGAASVGTWCYLLLGRGRFWLVRDQEALPTLKLQPSRVAVIVPARNEALVVGDAVHSLVTQDYPGPLHVFLADDESSDDTPAATLRAAKESGRSHQLTVVAAGPRPSGWTGKLWAVSQGIREAQGFSPDYFLFTDADIVHDRDVITQLVTLAASGDFDLASVMVRLRCETFAERALIPAFVFFFFMLYPPAWVKDATRRTAAAAGGCILIRHRALEAIGGIATISGELIDDCALARAVKRTGGRLWIGNARQSRSIREYLSWWEVGQMISRTAFTQLRHSIFLLGLTVLGMFVTFLLPIVLVFHGGTASILGLTAWILMIVAFIPTLRLYSRSPFFSLCLPLIALFYLGATLHSAVQYWRGKGGLWKGRVQDPDHGAVG
jgi:hopene-associated glycosyltransferase HpnB